jgi:hypothetical protein
VIRAGHSPQDYCDYLIDMARTLRRQGGRLNVIGMAMPGSGLPDRLKHIFEELPMQPLSRAKATFTLAFCITSSGAVAAATLAPRLDPGRAPVTTAVKPSTAGQSVVPAKAEVQADREPQDPATKKTPPTLTAPEVKVQPPHLVIAVEKTPPHVMIFVPKVDLSGEWVQVDSVYTGAGRGGANRPALGGPDGKRMISLISGAAVNCGATCSIVQEGNTLTITRPPTQSPDNRGTSAVLQTDGTESTIAEGSAQMKATASWQGDKLVVYRMITSNLDVTQTLSIVNGKLHVESMFSKQDAPVTLIYEKR